MEFKSVQSFSFNFLSDIVQSKKKMLFVSARTMNVYIDNKKTEKFESVICECLTDGLGTVKVVIPYRDGLLDEIESNFSFGEPVTIDNFGIINDVKISNFQGKLNFKFLVMNFGGK